jgi:nucleotide-binding universal stress UspA family protein
MQSSGTAHFRQIICPVDMSALSDLAIKYAYVGARQFEASLTVLYAMHFDYPRYLSSNLTAHVLKELENAKSAARREIEGHVRRVLGDKGNHVKIGYHVADTEPAEAILLALDQKEGDLVVMGTHGYSGIKHWMLGSVTENVLHHSPVPVFTVRQKINDFIDPAQSEAQPRIRHILCPCNQTVTAGQALQVATSLADRFEARLTILSSQESDAVVDEAALLEWSRKRATGGTAIDAVVRKGAAAEQAITLAKEMNCDLIVIGAHHQTFEQGTVVGRTTELVLRHAPVPVLSVPHYN